MIQTLKNKHGYVYGYIEYTVVDFFGKVTNGGEYGYIRRCWIHEDHRRNQLEKLIQKVDNDPEFNNVKWVYWINEKQNDRQTPPYRRERLRKLGAKYAQV